MKSLNAHLIQVIWHKISNASFEANNGTKFLGKPYEPNAIIKNDIEFILMQRKPGGYRQPTEHQRKMSLIAKDDYAKWFRQFWTITGASTKSHPAPYPYELANRLVRMFSFCGDTVLDPFCGTGTTMLAAMKTGRNSIGIEIDPAYHEMAAKRLLEENQDMFSAARLEMSYLTPHPQKLSMVKESSKTYGAPKKKTPRTKKRSRGGAKG